MASNNRNKLDEYHLKILRELLTHPANKYCFDCHQRGPTYVNITIGSFVCTSCSGMLRGITPPHRVKSITMATFTPEEIEIMKSRGNQYCRNVWLELYDAEVPTSDDQQIKDFMIAKYEKKRYYVDPSLSANHIVNGSRTPSSLSSTSSSSHNSPSSQNLSDSSSKIQSTLRTQATKRNSFTTSNNNTRLFNVNFESPASSSSSIDPFGSCGLEDSSLGSEASFANFDNNPIFDSNKVTPGVATETASNFGNKNNTNVPPEDKYAALKDLDFQMKSQLFEKQQQEIKQKFDTNLDWGDINSWTVSANETINPFSFNSKDKWIGNISWQKSRSQIPNAPVTPNGWPADVINPFKHQMGVWTQSNGQHQSNNPFL